jgi:hypothetical protein
MTDTLKPVSMTPPAPVMPTKSEDPKKPDPKKLDDEDQEDLECKEFTSVDRQKAREAMMRSKPGPVPSSFQKAKLLPEGYHSDNPMCR